MKSMRRIALIGATVVMLTAAVGGAPGQPAKVKIKKWKADPVELLDKPEGKVVATKAAAELPAEAVRTGQGWLEVSVDGQKYYVEASQARTDLKLSGKPKCDNIGGANGYAASRGLGEEGCEP